MNEEQKADFKARINAAIKEEPSFNKNEKLQEIQDQLRELHKRAEETAAAEKRAIKRDIGEDISELLGATLSGDTDIALKVPVPPEDESERYYPEILNEKIGRPEFGGGGKRRRSKKRRSKKRRSKKRRTKKRRTKKRRTSTRKTRRR